MAAPKVSVVCPVYNAAAYIARCLDSLLNQSLRDLEIIVVDDGSSDGGPEIARKYAERDRRIKIIRQANAGAAAARNAGLDSALGEYVGFCDADDYVDADYYEKLYAAAGGADIAKGRELIICLYGLKRKEIGRKTSQAFKDHRLCQISHKSSIFRREFLLRHELRFPHGVLVCEDNVFCLQALFSAKNIAFSGSRSFYYYALRRGSLYSGRMDDQKIVSIIRAQVLIVDFINGLNLSAEVYNEIFSRSLIYLANDAWERTASAEMRRALAGCLFELWPKCRFPALFAKENPGLARLLTLDEKEALPALFAGGEVRDKIYRLWGLTLFKIRNKPQKISYRLFGRLPVFAKKRRPFQANPPTALWKTE